MEMNWLSDLEEKIGRATAEIEQLREENRSLKGNVKSLRRQLAEARAQESAGGEWEKQRDEIERRVSQLVAHLEELV